MKNLAPALVAIITLAGCGAAPLMPAAVQGASGPQAFADKESDTAQRRIRDLLEGTYPGLIVKSLVAQRDEEVGIALYAYKGVGTYKGQHVRIDGAYIRTQDRLSASYLRDDDDNLIKR